MRSSAPRPTRLTPKTGSMLSWSPRRARQPPFLNQLPLGRPEARGKKQPVMTPRGQEGTLAAELQSVTQLGLQKIGQILKLPTDPHNGNVLRAQTTAAATAVNAQLKADETKMKQVQQGDILPRLLKIMEIEKAKLMEMDRA